MKKFGKVIDNRKVLVARISELAGIPARYTFVPRCAYEIGAFTVEKDGSLTAADGADGAILATLKSENMIGEEIAVSMPLEGAAHTGRNSQAPEPPRTTIGTEEWGEEDDGEEPPTIEEEPPIWHPETDIFADDPIPDEEEPGSRDARSGARTTGDPQEEMPGPDEDAEPIDVSISFPLGDHSAASIINLVCMMHSRGELLSKATGGYFYADKSLANELLDHTPFVRAQDAVDFIKKELSDGASLIGLSFDEGKVIFDGFGPGADADHLQSFMKLAAAMNKMAITQKRIQVKQIDMDNEKYALRIWLIRLGLGGKDTKDDRKRLMENLSGHTAFRNDEDRKRWTERQAAKKEALRAAKKAASNP